MPKQFLDSITISGTTTSTLFSGSGANLTSIPNSALVNNSITIGTTPIALGASSTTLSGLTSVISTSFVGTLTGSASSCSGNALTATTATTALACSGNSNTATTAGTVTTAAQPNITSVGTLTGLTVTATIVGSINGNAATATTAETVTTAAQPAITSVGTLTSLSVTGAVGASQFNGSGAGITALTLPIGSINATGTPGSSTYLCGNGTWATVTAPLSIPISAINATGTPSTITYLRGDGTWSSGGAGVSLAGTNTWTALNTFSAGMAGTLQTPAQPNITSLGTLTSLTTSGAITPTGGLNDTGTGASWVSQMTDASVLVKGNVSTASYRAYIQSTTTGSTNHTFTLGNLGNQQFGFYGYLNSRVANGTDFSCFMDTVGNWYTSGQCNSTQFNGSGAGLTGTATSLSIGGNAGSVGGVSLSGLVQNNGGNYNICSQYSLINNITWNGTWQGSPSASNPGYVWGNNGLSGTQQLFNTGNLSVNYANSAGSAPANGGTATYATYNTSGYSLLALTGGGTTSGWRKTSEGLIIQWGTVGSGASSGTFPIGFSVLLSLVIGYVSNPSNKNNCGCQSQTTTGFTLFAQATGIQWIALGY